MINKISTSLSVYVNVHVKLLKCLSSTPWSLEVKLRAFGPSRHEMGVTCQGHIPADLRN